MHKTHVHCQSSASPVLRRHELGHPQQRERRLILAFLTMHDIPFLQQTICFMQVYSAYST